MTEAQAIQAVTAHRADIDHAMFFDARPTQEALL
jgi:hypothetical protein